jgi:hypothetical protein
LNLLHINEFEISASQSPTHYNVAGNGGMLHIIVHKNVRLSGGIVSDILDNNHIPIVFPLLEHVRTSRRKVSDADDKFTDCETKTNILKILLRGNGTSKKS